MTDQREQLWAAQKQRKATEMREDIKALERAAQILSRRGHREKGFESGTAFRQELHQAAAKCRQLADQMKIQAFNEGG